MTKFEGLGSDKGFLNRRVGLVWAAVLALLDLLAAEDRLGELHAEERGVLRRHLGVVFFIEGALVELLLVEVGVEVVFRGRRRRGRRRP